LSQQLQRLEREVGVKLVARTSHEVRLTPAGVVFQEHARAITQQVDRAMVATQEAAAGRTGNINVGYNFPAWQYVLPVTIARMSAEYPNVTVTPWELRTGPQLKALASGDLDVALVYGRPAAGDLDCRKLLQVPMVAVVGRDHAWASRRRVAFGELVRQPCVLFEREQCPAMYDTLLAAARRNDITLVIAHQLDDPGATALVVATRAVVGFSSAPRGAAQAGFLAGELQLIPIPLHDPIPTLDLYAVWRAHESNPLVRAFLSCLQVTAPADGSAGERRSSDARDS
jgi:DNA-binding transcriptional LysR family regulator